MTNKPDGSDLELRALRVLVVDNVPVDRTDHEKNLQEWGYMPFVAEGAGRALIEDAKRQARAQRCHAAIVDMRLFDDHDVSDRSGLELVPHLKPARCIVVTGYGSLPASRKANEYGAVMVGKEERSEAVRSELEQALQDVRRSDFTIAPAGWLEKHILPYLKSDSGQPVQANEVRDVLAMLFPDARRVHLGNLPRAILPTPTPTSGLRGSSVVVSVKADNWATFVIKFAAPRRIVQERTNYDSYVKDRIQDRHHAQMSRHKRFWNVGAIIYSFSGEGDISLFRAFYRDHEVEKIVTALRDFFQSVWQPLYADRSDLSDSLFAAYDRLWARLESGGPLVAKLADWAKLDKTRSFSGIQGRVSDPRRWIAENHPDSALPSMKQCVVHGDLNGENLFVDIDGHTWAIDFERTGVGHIFTDFVEMEHYILSQLTQAEDLSTYFALAVAITSPSYPGDEIPEPNLEVMPSGHSHSNKAIEVIRGLRAIARELFQYTSQLEYYWALLHDVLYGIQRLERLQESNVEVEQELEKALLLGGVLCERIEKWHTDDRWPLKKWGLGTSRSHSDPTGIGDTARIQLPPRSALEKIIRSGNRFQDIESWTARCSELAARVCRVEVPANRGTILGTGFLVGPDLMMTNFHVIETLLPGNQSGSLPENVLLRFSYKRTADGNNLDVGVTYRLASDDWLVDSSPYADEGSVPSLDRLDYALLRLNGQPGEDWVNGGNRQRGWIEIPAEPYRFTKDSGLIIIQHPKGEPVKLAIDTESVIGVDSSGTLVNYRTNTDEGSSGSPCFSLDWELVALHHSGDPGWRPTFNAGTPIRVIMKRLRERRLDHLIGKLK